MLRIFRNLRKEGILKKSKYYLWYALGEIFLVVIGILIALYINNESEQYKEKKNEIVLLNKLKEENIYNLNTLIDGVDYHKSLPKTYSDFTYYLINHKVEELTDSLGYFLNETMRTPTYSFSQGNLANYINSQKNNFPEVNKEIVYLQNLEDDLYLISNKSVDIKLENYYSLLKSEIDFMTGDLYSTQVINSVEFRNNLYLIQSVEQEFSRIFDLTVNQMQKVDSLLIKVLKGN